MSIAFDHRDPGTSEEEWDAASPWRDAPSLSLDVERVLVLAAHPDDETLGAGGLIATASAAGIRVDVVVVTDGEASHPHLELRTARRTETIEALADLAPGASVSFLGVPDGAVREHATAVRAAVQAALAAADARTVLVAAPWEGDGHRDHRVLGEIARDVESGAVQVVGYPIWLWHWGDPSDVDATRWRVVPMTTETRVAKQRAIGRHRTQVSVLGDDPPVLHGMMLQHFTRPFEVFVVASDGRSGSALGSGSPPESGSATPAFFEQFHQRYADPWGLESRWYEQRKRDVLLACLPHPTASAALEIGCATGVLTERLRERADRLLAIDVSETALAKAAQRVGDDPSVTLRRAHLPAEWPTG